jgi:hypothetical protein
MVRFFEERLKNMRRAQNDTPTAPTSFVADEHSQDGTMRVRCQKIIQNLVIAVVVLVLMAILPLLSCLCAAFYALHTLQWTPS